MCYEVLLWELSRERTDDVVRRNRINPGVVKVKLSKFKKKRPHHRLEPMPVILIIYDAADDVAYWLYVQAYCERRQAASGLPRGKTVTLDVPLANVVDEAAMKRFAGFKNAVLAQRRGVVHHE